MNLKNIMKTPKTTKEKRNQEIATLAFEDGKSYTEIGKIFKISPQRAQQIARRERFKKSESLGIFKEAQIKTLT